MPTLHRVVRRGRDPSAALGMPTLHWVVTFRVGLGMGPTGRKFRKPKRGVLLRGCYFRSAEGALLPLLKQGASSLAKIFSER